MTNLGSSFHLRAHYFGATTVLQLTDAEAEQVKAATEVNLNALHLEELYDGVVADYLELETEILNATAEFIVKPDAAIGQIDKVRRLFNRRLMHLLSVVRTYIEVAPRYLGLLISDADRGRGVFKAATSSEYDALLGYRVLEALRNSAQHWGLPLHSVSLNSQLMGDVGTDAAALQVRHSIEPQILLAELRRSEKFKRKVLNELEAGPESIDLRPLVRQYVEGLSTIHDAARAVSQDHCDEAERITRDAIRRWELASSGKDKTFGLVLARMTSPATWDVVVQVTTRAIDACKALRRQNPRLVGLVRSYASNEL